MLKTKWVILFSLGFLAADWAGACPFLAGIYDCTTNGHHEQIIIHQREVSLVTLYQVAGTEIVADGQSHTLPNREPEEEALYQATCHGEALRVVVEQILIGEGANKTRIGTLDFELWMNRDPAGKLHRKVQGIVSIDGGGNYPVSEGTVCVPR